MTDFIDKQIKQAALNAQSMFEREHNINQARETIFTEPLVSSCCGYPEPTTDGEHLFCSDPECGMGCEYITQDEFDGARQ